MHKRSEHLLVHMKISGESLVVLNGRGWASQPQLSRVIAHHHLVKQFKSAAPGSHHQEKRKSACQNWVLTTVDQRILRICLTWWTFGVLLYYNAYQQIYNVNENENVYVSFLSHPCQGQIISIHLVCNQLCLPSNFEPFCPLLADLCVIPP